MEQKMIFREMLSEIKALADSKKNQLTKQEIDEFFSNAHLEQEQMELIYEYLRSQKITVAGYEKQNEAAGRLFENREEADRKEETENRGQWEGMKRYLEELDGIEKAGSGEELLLFQQAVKGDAEARKRLAELYLPMVCELAADFEGEEMLVEDLIQEGNLGLILTLEKLEMTDHLAAFQAQLMNGVNRSMQQAIEASKDVREMGKGIENKVNHLSQAIHNMEEDLEHRVSVEELSAYLEMPAEEIKAILKMAGDELEVEGYEVQ